MGDNEDTRPDWSEYQYSDGRPVYPERPDWSGMDYVSEETLEEACRQRKSRPEKLKLN